MEVVFTDTQVDGGRLMRAVMSLSGGMDSTCLLLKLLSEGYKVSCISFDYGQSHVIEIDKAKMNIEFLKRNGQDVDHKIVDLTSTVGILNSTLTNDKENIPEGFYEKEQMKSTVVPNRNAIFSSIVYGYALSISVKEDMDVKIALGVHSGDHAIYPDCRPEFYESLEKSFQIGNWGSERVSFELPYLSGDKVTILRDALNSCRILDLDFDYILNNTITSYNPDDNGISSGRSGSDVERILAFDAINRIDPIEYQEPWDVVLANAKKEQLRHYVMKQSGTERAFTGEYDKHFETGRYHCADCNIVLFESAAKFDSGCGWPAFSSEHEDANITQLEDYSHGMTRIEVRCSKCDSHLGHLFHEPRGPRYCINSICLEFKGE